MRRAGTVEQVLMNCPVEGCPGGLRVDISWYKDDGQLTGPPEDCYPPEESYEITQADFLCDEGHEVDPSLLEPQLEQWWRDGGPSLDN